MDFADSSGVRVAYVLETQYGVTPATPSFKTLRATSGGLRTTKATGVSNERQPDRNVRDQFELGQDVAGDINFELTYGSFDDMLEALLFGTWTTNVLKNGNVYKSFTWEETIPVGDDELFSRFTGVAINSASFTVTSRAEITGTLSAMGQKETLDDAVITDATYAAPATTPVMTSSANIADLDIDGLTEQPAVRSLTINIANNLRTRPVVGSKFSEKFGVGRFEVSLNLEIYLSSQALYQKVLDHGRGSLSFVAGVATGEKYRFTFPNIVFGDGSPNKGGNNDDITLPLTCQAIYDATEACTMKIERAVA